MSTEPVPPPPPPPPSPPPKFNLAAWLQSIGLGGKLLLGGAVLGILSVFLTAMSVSSSTSVGPLSGAVASVSALVWDFWQGKIELLAFIACGMLTYLVYQPTPHKQQRNLTFATLGSAGLAVILALWLFINVATSGNRSSVDAGPFKMEVGVHVSIGFGCILGVVAAGLAAAGAYFKAKDERLF
jgi:hypothetical protein